MTKITFLTKDEKSTITRLRKEGRTSGEISELTGRPRGTITGFFLRSGLSKTRGEAVRASRPRQHHSGTLSECRNCGANIDRSRIANGTCPICCAPHGLEPAGEPR